MTFTLLGATGWIGSHVLHESVARGHDIIAVARDVSPLPSHERIHPRRADINDPHSLQEVLRGATVVVSSVQFLMFHPDVLLSGLRHANVSRYLCVGGAGSLRLADGSDLVDSPGFPAEYRDEALAGREYLRRLQATPDLDWVLVSPPAMLEEGGRTGHYRVGGDSLRVDANGESRICVADFAVALIDELERPRHHRTRFTVAC
jgi:putative NADH-flavin reductase